MSSDDGQRDYREPLSDEEAEQMERGLAALAAYPAKAARQKSDQAAAG